MVVIISGKRISVGSSEDPAFFIYEADAIGRVRGRALVITHPPRQLESTFSSEVSITFLDSPRRGHGQDARGQESRCSTRTECFASSAHQMQMPLFLLSRHLQALHTGGAVLAHPALRMRSPGPACGIRSYTRHHGIPPKSQPCYSTGESQS